VIPVTARAARRSTTNSIARSTGAQSGWIPAPRSATSCSAVPSGFAVRHSATAARARARSSGLSSRYLTAAPQSELVRLYPDRASVPREVWLRMMTDAAAHIDVLVFSGTFYTQTQPRVAAMLAGAAERGVEVRLCFGDPASEAVATRDREEGLSGTLAHKIRSALTYYRPLAGVDGCQMRLHATTLYASLFRYDDEIMANPHAYGEPASANPTLHLRRLDGGQVAEHYIACFERVWESAKPWFGEEV